MLSILDPVDIDDLVVYRDDEDPRKFYLLPDKPVISTDDDGTPDFYFIQYTGLDAGHKEGGYVQFRTVLTIPPARHDKVMAALKDMLTQDQASGHKPFGLPIVSTDPVLADPLWTKGTVSILTMQAAPDGLVTVSPDQPLPCDLAGALGASGRMSLSPDGASVFWAAFSDKTTQKLPILITYQLTYRARVSATLTIDADGTTVIQQLWERADPKPYVYNPPLRRFIALPFIGKYNLAAHQQMLRINPNCVPMVQPDNITKAVHSCVTDKTINVVINTDSGGGTDGAPDKVQEALFTLATNLLTKDIIPAIFGTGQDGTAPQPQPASDNSTDPKPTTQVIKMPSQDTSTLHFHISMTSNSVIDRNVNPNGALELLISDPTVLASCFRQIPLGNDFFSKKHVLISTAGINFDQDGISAINVSGRYNATDEIGHHPPVGALHPDVSLKSATDTGHWDFALSRDSAGVPKNQFEYTTRVYYNNMVLTTDWQPWETDALTVNPAAMGAVRVQLALTAKREEVRSVSVALSYRKASGEVLSDVVILTPDDGRKTWIKTTGEIRPPGATAPLEYTYQLTYQTIAAGQITLPQQTGSQDTLEVPTPFPKTLNFLFTPQGSFADVAAIAGDVTYEDAAHGYKVVRTFSLEKLTASFSMDVPILDGGPQQVSWVARIVHPDGSQTPLPPGQGGVGNHLVGLVEFKPFVVKIMSDLLSLDTDVRLAAVKLTYHDPVNGDVMQEMKFNKASPVEQTWTVPQYSANSPKKYDIDVHYYGYDRSKDSELHLKDVTDVAYELDRSLATPPH